MRKSLLAAAVALCPITTQAAPNVLLVIADDMGVDASPCHAQGSLLARMPTLSKLCAEGMVYDNAHAYPTCSPTRASILTGLYSDRTGVGAAVQPKAGNGLNDKTASLFDKLDASTPYSAAVVGKWHLADKPRDLDHPSKLGVDTYFGITGGGVKDYESWRAVENGKARKVSGYVTTEITDYAIDWISDQNQPWFMWLAYTAPHTPFHAPPSALHSFGSLSTNSATIRRDPRKHYFAALEALDHELGRLLDSLSNAERQDTIVIFTGDNGTPRQVARKLNTQKDAKGTIYNGGTQVPMVIAGPGIRAGRTSQPVQVTDLHDTILAITGANGQTHDSFDLSPSFQGNTSARAATYIHAFGPKSSRGKPVFGWSMANESHVLIAPNGQPPQLYETSDTGQRRDLFKTKPSQAEIIAQEFLALRDDYIR